MTTFADPRQPDLHILESAPEYAGDRLRRALPHASRLERMGIDFPFMIAPMVGLSNVAFRALVRSYTPASARALLFTEMLSTRRIPDEKIETTNELKCAPGEAYFVPQLLGNEEKYIAPSIGKLLAQDPWGFDINMGCPVARTLKHNWGVRLMGDTDYAADVVRMVKRHSPKPVSVKMRGSPGAGEDLETLLAFTAALEEAGADWLTIHPRPRAQHHKGEANWRLVGEVRAARGIPVVANGDIQTSEDALDVYRDFKVDGCMVARAATARPWILWQIAEDLGVDEAPPGRHGQRAPRSPEEEGREYINACLSHIDFMTRFFPTEDYVLEKFRFFAATGARWFAFGHAFWKLTTKAKSVAELRDAVAEYGARCESPMAGRIKFL